jgi:hypothetical protein
MLTHRTDEAMADHARRSAGRGDTPYLERFKGMDMDERWVNRSAYEMLETVHWFQGEAFGV